MTNAVIYPMVNEDIENVLRRLRKVIEKDNVLADYKRHREFRSKSEKRRSKQNAARARINGGRFRVRA